MIFLIEINHPITACKQYCLAAGAIQGNIAYTQTVRANGRGQNLRKTISADKKLFVRRYLGRHSSETKSY